MQHSGSFGIFSSSMQTLSYGKWGLVPRLGIKPRPPALGAWSLNHWTSREALEVVLLEEGRLATVVHECSCALCACVNTCTGRGRVLSGSLDGTGKKELVGDCGPRNVMDRNGRRMAWADYG